MKAVFMVIAEHSQGVKTSSGLDGFTSCDDSHRMMTDDPVLSYIDWM